MNGLLGNFTADESIYTKVCRLVNEPLTTAGTPGDATDLIRPALRAVQHFAIQNHFHALT
ncbi:hypothetical protein D3C75_1343460 [compost metagenome]